jgi:hypothetical protein
MFTCPNGHASEWGDYCSSCGAPIAGPPLTAAPPTAAPVAAAPPAPLGDPCPACGEPRAVGAPFCEACGFDFTAPTPSEATPSVATPATAPSAALVSTDGTPNAAVIVCDRAYFDDHSGGSGLTFPDPAPVEWVIPLRRDIVLLGRHSQSRGIYPDIDLSDEHDDPAASHRHAELRRTPDGWTLVDLGSTNGTRLDPTSAPLTPGTPSRVAPEASFFLGAWTRVTLSTR